MESKNTIPIVDAEALRQGLEDAGVEYVEIKGKNLNFCISRYTMNEDGYYIGYEYYRGRLPLHKKSDFLTGVGGPWSLSPYFVCPDQLDTKLVGRPYKQRGYYPADSEFVFHEVKFFLDNTIIPEWRFNHGTREAGGTIEESWELLYEWEGKID